MTLGRADRAGSILDVLRAVAKTRWLRFAKEKAREEPMPPALQPVIKTDFWDAILLGGLCARKKRRKD